MKRGLVLSFLVALQFFFLAGQSVHAKGIYYMVKEDGSLCITDIPNSRKYKPYKFQKTINYIRNAIVAFKRDHRSVEEVNTIVSGLCSKYDVDKKLVMAVIDVESGFNAAAVSRGTTDGSNLCTKR